MKTTDIRFGWQVLTLVIIETGCVYRNSTRHTPVITENASIIRTGKLQPLFQNYSLGITNTVFKRNGQINKKPRLGSLVKSFRGIADPKLRLSCEMPNQNKSTTLNTRYKPHLTVNHNPKKVYEGQPVTLCCCSASWPSTLAIWWSKRLVLSSKYDTGVLCHKIISASRNDSGNYRCFAENEIEIVNEEVILKVLYPPDIPDQHINFTDTEVSRSLKCLAHGVPANYSYGQWKHLSNFGEHIRYLNSTTDGRVILPQIANNIERYQDNGKYICTASNEVVDRTGNSFQNGKIFVIANGPPVFVQKIEDKQYGQPGKKLNLELIVYTESEITCYNVKSANIEITSSMQMTRVNSTTIFHGTEITVEAIDVVLSFYISNNSSHIYTVTLCNGYGNESFVVELKPLPVEEKITHGTKVAIIIILVILVMCVPVSVAGVLLRRKRNRNRNRRIVDDIPESVEGQPVPGENSVYQSTAAFRPTPHQSSGEVVEYNNETYSHEQTMRPLTGQLNYSEMYFQPSTSQDVRIIGIENRTVYSDVIISERGSGVIDTRSISSSDEEDFVDIEGLENFMDRSEDI